MINSFLRTKRSKKGTVGSIHKIDGMMRIIETYVDNLSYLDLVVLSPTLLGIYIDEITNFIALKGGNG